VAATLADVITRYRLEHLPELAKATGVRGSRRSYLFSLHLRFLTQLLPDAHTRVPPDTFDGDLDGQVSPDENETMRLMLELAGKPRTSTLYIRRPADRLRGAG
jgi:hypothetical protein